MALFKSEGVGEVLKRIYIDFSKLLFQYILNSRSVQTLSVIIYEFDKKQPVVIKILPKLEDIKAESSLRKNIDFTAVLDRKLKRFL